MTFEKLRDELNLMMGAAGLVFDAEASGTGLAEAINELRFVRGRIFYDRAHPVAE